MDGADRVCTGIAGLDTQMGGGVPRGTSALLIAESTNALYQFLNEMAAFGIKEGEEVLWFELDRPWSLLERSLNAAIPEHRDRLTVLDAYGPDPASGGRNGSSGYNVERTDPKTVPDLVTDRLARVEPENYRLVLTSLSSLLQQRDTEEVLTFLRQVVAMGEDLGGLQLFTLIKDAHSPREVAMLKHACTAVFELGMERKGFDLYSYLKVAKLLGIQDATRLMLFNETEDGLRLESTQRVF